MLREYEFTYIIRPDLSDDARSEVVSKYENLILGDSGQLVRKQDWGLKRLTYPIKKQFRGYYVHYDFATAKKENLAECERLMRIDENVLRYLLIKIADDVNVETRKAELAKSEKVAREQQRLSEEKAQEGTFDNDF